MNKPRSWNGSLRINNGLEQVCKPAEGLILVAEDDEDHFLLLVLALEKAGIKNPVLRVSNGQDALDYIERTNHYSDPVEHPAPALVFLDLRMPVMDGIDVLAAMHSRPRKKEIPVIVLSSSLDSLTMELATRLGAKEGHQKPVHFRALIVLVREICGRWLNPIYRSDSRLASRDVAASVRSVSM